MFEETQVILFAVKTFMSTRNDFEILLNPSNSYVIKKTDVCVYIAEGPREVQDISTLVSMTMHYVYCIRTYGISYTTYLYSTNQI